ncbi:MAG: hypothetical protein WC476_07110 [Phycisphaerae bacterium]|jgi:hypothetical protein
MVRISEKIIDNDESFVSLADKVQKPFEEEIDLYKKIDDLDKEQGFLRTRSEQAFNIGLSAFSEINLLKNKIKALEQIIPSLPTHKVPKTVKKDIVSDAQTEQIFNELAKQWEEETINLSYTQQKVLHPAYQKIIGLGPKVIPLVLEELRRKPLQWFWALRALTRTDPVSEDILGNAEAMRKAWLDWGSKHVSC